MKVLANKCLASEKCTTIIGISFTGADPGGGGFDYIRSNPPFSIQISHTTKQISRLKSSSLVDLYFVPSQLACCHRSSQLLVDSLASHMDIFINFFADIAFFLKLYCFTASCCHVSELSKEA